MSTELQEKKDVVAWVLNASDRLVAPLEGLPDIAGTDNIPRGPLQHILDT